MLSYNNSHLSTNAVESINYINSVFALLFTYQLVSTINCLISCCKDFWEFVVILRHNVINKYILFYTTSW